MGLNHRPIHYKWIATTTVLYELGAGAGAPLAGELKITKNTSIALPCYHFRRDNRKVRRFRRRRHRYLRLPPAATGSCNLANSG